jgi:toxin ParE1/3/4
MAQVIWTEPALSDLDAIAEYIAVNNFEAAQKLVRTVFEKTDRLEKHPKSGKKPRELPKLDYREVVVSPCRVFYKVAGGRVLILHVMRQEQALRKYMLQHQ